MKNKRIFETIGFAGITAGFISTLFLSFILFQQLLQFVLQQQVNGLHQ